MIPPSDEQWRNCYAELDRLRRKYRRKTPVEGAPNISEAVTAQSVTTQPAVHAHKRSLVELFEQQLKKLGARNKS